MNKKLFIFVFLCFFICSLMLLCQEGSKEKKKWEDKRIGITLDKLEKTDSYPEELRTLIETPFRKVRYPSPKKGNDFVFIYFTVVKVNEEAFTIKLDEFGYNKSKLFDTQGNVYTVHEVSCKMSPKGGWRIGLGEGHMYFEMPKDAVPSQLKFIYPYREESLNPEELKHEQIDIDLSHIQ